MSTAIEMEVVTNAVEVPKELETAVAKTGLTQDGAKSLAEAFAPHFVKFHKTAEDAKAVKENAPKAARAVRLALRSIRVEADKTREELKAESLRRGKAIDGINNILKFQLVPIEEAMEKIEKAEELAEAKRISDLTLERSELLRPYADPTFYTLGIMPEAQWSQLLAGAKAAHQAKIDAAAKAESDRIAKEKAEAEERERIKAENERLRQEAIAAEAKAKAEREAAAKARAIADAKAKKEREEAEAKLKAARDEADRLARIEREKAEAALKIEREKSAKAKAEADAKALKERIEQEEKLKAEIFAREKLEAEKARAAAAEQKRIADEALAKKKAAAAPDKEKLMDFAASLKSSKPLEMSTEDGFAAAREVQKLVGELANKITAIAYRL